MLSKKIIASVLTVCLVLSFATISYGANTITLSESVPAIEAVDAVETATDATRVREILDKRESNGKVYLMSDGTYQAVINSDTIHYINQDQEYAEIDNTIVKSDGEYLFQNKANRYRASFNDLRLDDYPVNLSYDGMGISFGFDAPKSENVSILKGASPSMAALVEKTEKQKIDDSNRVAYTNVYPGIDYEYITLSNGLKENIVLKEPTAQNEFVFNIKLNGLKIKDYGNSNVALVDEKGTHVFEMGNLFAYDANGQITEDVYGKHVVKNGIDQIVITVDKDYLANENRVWPVVVDPTFMVTGGTDTYDTYASSRYPSNNYSSLTYLRTGRDSDYYVRRTYIKFNLYAWLEDVDISNVSLNIKYYSGATPSSVRAYASTGYWSANTLNWNNMPSYTTMYMSGAPTVYGNNWYKFNVTNMVQAWHDYDLNNCGFVLRDLTESGTSQWTTFYSSEAPSPNKPELVYTYTEPPAPTTKYVSFRRAYDPTFVEEYGSGSISKINSIMNNANYPFRNKFNIEFTTYANTYVSTSASQCEIPWITDSCCDWVGYPQYDCGTAAQCILLHHKNIYVNHDDFISLGRGNANALVGFLGAKTCGTAAALSTPAYKTATIPAPNLSLWDFEEGAVRRVQHEVSHLFGCYDNGCDDGSPCIMSGGWDGYGDYDIPTIWCAYCEDVFDRNAL